MRIAKNGDVHVSAPFGMPKSEVERFIEDHREWIAEARRKTCENQKRRAEFYNQLPLKTREQADDALRRLKALIEPMVERHSKEMGVSPSVINYKAMISRWGVCNAKDRSICFSIYLLLLPGSGAWSMWWFTNCVICLSPATMLVSMHSWISSSPDGRKLVRLQNFEEAFFGLNITF